jgi:lysyl-tRNA synthetase class 2
MRRANMFERAQQYFAAQDVLAVDTPALGRYAASDRNIASISAHTGSGEQLYLQTSPEMYMKRMLASGYPDIYSICRVFRDGETGKRHNPEFTMTEWYRLGFSLSEIIDDTVGFIAACLNLPRLTENVVQFDYATVFRKFADVDAFTASADELLSRYGDDERFKSVVGDDRDAALDLIMSTVVAPQFSADELTVIKHYPADQAALSRICPHDSRVADRFEVFCGDLELANGYVELTDADEQRRRFEQDIETRQTSGDKHFAVDEPMLAALDAGLPDCAGVAIGMERLQMLLDQSEDIGDVVTFTL